MAGTGQQRFQENTETMAIDWQAFWLTLQLAITVSAILLVLGLPIAYWIAFSRWRGKFLIEALVALPIVLPPTVLGFYVLVALGPRSPLGRWWISLTGHTLAFTFSGLVIGSILYSLPFAVQPFAASFAGVDRKLIAASATLGRFPAANFLSRDHAALRSRTDYRRGPELCSHHGRIRRRAHGRRKYSRRHAHRLDRYLRPRAGFRLRRRQRDRTAVARVQLRRAGRCVRNEPQGVDNRTR